MTEIQFPATQTVHTPSGPTNACDKHAAQLNILFGSFFGAHTNSTVLLEPTECANCVNENSKNTQRN